MRARTSGLAGLAIFLTVAIPAFAQFGHPLKGSWSGDWGQGQSERHRLLLLFDWDGNEISGILNPGPDAVPMKNITLTPPCCGIENADRPWSLRFEAEIRDSQGNAIPIVVDGAMENLGAYRRFITGVWSQGDQKGTFRVTRN